jgi:uncharacterized protein YkwD
MRHSTRRALATIFSLLLAFPLAASAGAQSFGDTAFESTWQRTDLPVAQGQAMRTWMWGPQPFTAALTEGYADSPGGLRTVQYFDKARMEITHPGEDPSSIWFVTNGLLVTELVTGRLQIGGAQYEQRSPAAVNLAGDADDSDAPSYATMALVLDDQPNPLGEAVTRRIDRAGNVSVDRATLEHGVQVAVMVEETQHAIAAPFWDFMNASGVVYLDDAFVEDQLFQNPYFATGFPITEAYWATVRVGGSERDILFQCFERRCLTYTPDNAPEWRVEAGNVGRHYYAWRYESGDIPDPTPDPAPEPVPDPAPGGEPAAEAVCLDVGESAFLSLLNNYRAANGLAPLANSASLNVASYEHSLDMGERGFFSHQNPDGEHSWDRAEAAGYTGYTAVAENIAAGFDDAQAALDGWRDSPPHNATMLGAGYNAVGIGRVHVEGSAYGWYWTTVFGDLVDAAPACG